MNKVVERVKDLFYDATDYILVLIIVVVVSGIIAWRLDLLFAKNNDGSSSTNTATSQSSNVSSTNKKDASTNDLIEKEKTVKKV
ncbi:hypothetical protein [Gottschalkia acidurici]|uniref:hypothetical protein n=1 Tax=Clostridium acidurici TaxID=1556 RepID=UPI0002F2E75B|nr:hypothetical protein [Gottschalkia acidurici]